MVPRIRRVPICVLPTDSPHVRIVAPVGAIWATILTLSLTLAGSRQRWADSTGKTDIVFIHISRYYTARAGLLYLYDKTQICSDYYRAQLHGSGCLYIYWIHQLPLKCISTCYCMTLIYKINKQMAPRITKNIDW